MAEITETPSQTILDELALLRTQLDQEVPPKVLDKNLLIATWNIRAFGDLTKKWHAEADDTPKRDYHALVEITEIVSRFHVVAIQEVRGNIRSLRYMLKLLGPHWGVILTDVTKGTQGNFERLAFVFDTRVVQLSGLACELIIPPEQLEKPEIKPDALTRQFARTPYAVSFRAHDETFILVTMHALYGKGTADRKKELKAIAEWLAEWAKEMNEWEHNFIALGDFNIDREGDNLFDAFTSTGLRAPQELNDTPRTIFDNASNNKHFYDQIAWFTGEKGAPILSLKFLNAGYFDFTKFCLKSLNLEKTALSWRMSDHYPLWAEFSLRK